MASIAPAGQALDSVVQALKSEPDLGTLYSSLKLLPTPLLPSPKSAQVIYVLVNDVLPAYWPVLSQSGSGVELELLLKSLRNVTGVNAILAASSSAKDPSLYLDVLCKILSGENVLDVFAQAVFRDSGSSLQQDLLWKQVVSLFGAGIVLSRSAEAASETNYWVADGRLYTAWLGRNIRLIRADSAELLKARALMYARSLSLGHNKALVSNVFRASLSGEGPDDDIDFFKGLESSDQKKTISLLLRTASQKYALGVKDTKLFISSLAALLSRYTSGKEDYLVDWIGRVALREKYTAELSVRRAVIATFGIERCVDTFKLVLDRFSDKLNVLHMPVLQQKVDTQDLLLLFAKIKRQQPKLVAEISRSTAYLNAISNRLAAASKARLFGMVVGVVVSKAVDSEENRLKFDFDDSDEAEELMALSKVDDSIGDCKDVDLVDNKGPPELSANPKVSTDTKKIVTRQEKPLENGKGKAVDKERGGNEILEADGGNYVPKSFKLFSDAEQKEPEIQISKPKTGMIVELDEDDDDLPIYAKPDSDPEDEDDPTLVERNKPTEPVYIRDLLTGLRDSDNYNRFFLAISTAASLIRRKSSYGKEVTSHSEELAAQIIGLRDSYDIQGFDEMRIKAMIAIVVADPEKMAPWFANTLFKGDYSMAQRLSVLTSLSMAARELAGYAEEDAKMTGALTANAFPSKRLPEKMARAWGYETDQPSKAIESSSSAVNALADRLERTMIRPLAAQAADAAIGPDALKVRTFSSRMEVERRKKPPATNRLAKLVSGSFLGPLINLYRAFAPARPQVFAEPHLLAHLLKTLALIFAAAGTSSIALLALTAEMWDFVLAVPSIAGREGGTNNPIVLEGVLLCLLTVIDVNNESADGARRLAADHGRELIQTRDWAAAALEAGVEGKLEGIAAALLARCEEVVSKYQKTLAGDLARF